MDISYLAQLFERLVTPEFSSNLPLLILQSTSLIGILAILLIFKGSSILSKHLGLILGTTNFLVALLLSEWIQAPIKPFLRNDLLFIAGFFGGLHNATHAFILTVMGRLFFGGQGNALAAVLDIALITYGAVLLRFVIKEHSLETIKNSTVIKLICLRSIIVTFPVFVIYLLGLYPLHLTLELARIRFSNNFTISLTLLYASLIVLRREISRERQFYLDMVSGLPNRRALKKDITETFESRHITQPAPQTLMLIEIDNFYELIQEHDHDWADAFFKQSATVLQTLAEKPFLAIYRPKIYSFSDRSFVMILHDITMHQIQEKELANNILGNLFITPESKDNPLRARLTTGIIDIDYSSEFSPSWFLRALNSMEKNTHASIHYFESTITRQIQLDNRLRIQIEKWISEGCVPLWLQPKVLLKSHTCIGAEALLRTQDNESGERYISPPHIISIAEKHHLLAEMEWAGMQTIVRHLQHLPAALHHLKFSINLSPESLTDPDFGKRVCALLSQHGIHGERLTIEVIETSELPLTETVQENIAILLQYGVSLSLDDFGSGYASLALLSKLPFNELKLDYAMISSLENPRTHAAIMLSINSAKHYAARIVAEGIETEKQAQQLMEMGVDHGQGFLFGRAMPFDDFLVYAQQHIAPHISLLKTDEHGLAPLRQ